MDENWRYAKVRGGRKIDSSVKASAIHSPIVVSLINLIVLHFSNKLSEKTAKVGSSSSIALCENAVGKESNSEKMNVEQQDANNHQVTLS